MNRITLAAAALFVALIGNASTPTTHNKTPLKKVSKVQGTPTVSGLGQQALIRQTFAPASGIVNSMGKTFDPKTILEVKYANDQKHPVFFKSTRTVATEKIQTANDAQIMAIQFLESHKPLLNVNSPKDEFVIKSFEKDFLGYTHIKMTQTYMGKTVWGKEIILHFGTNQSSANGRWAATPSLPSLTSSISSQTAISKAVSDAKPTTLSDAANKLLQYTGPTSELVLYPKDAHNSKDRWAYRVVVRPNFLDMYEYFIDAVTGEIVRKTNVSCTTGTQSTQLTDLNGVLQTLNTYQDVSNTYYMIDITRPMFNTASQMPNNPQGALWTVDANFSVASNIQVQQLTSADNTTWPSSATAASAATNGATAYSYYKNVHGRNSIDGNGGTIISVINVNENGQGMDNAFWNGQLMAYGNGNTYFKPLAGGVDVAGHEMTHGVIQATANLQYQDQSGALNESMADVFGVLISGSNYTIGNSVVQTAYFPSGALRSLSDPHNGTTQGNNGWQPAVMSEYVTGTSDNGGVHTNSGIPNHAFYYFASAVSKQTADSIYYRALTKYLTTSSQFLDARLAVVQSATDLYGAGSPVVHYAGAAFDSVGIFDGVPTTTLDTASVNGADWIIYQNTDSTNTNTLYLIPAGTPSNATALTNIPALNRVSVTDNGSNAYFVGTNHNVYNITINTTGSSTVNAVSGLNNGEWDFVSVSRDGSKLALISKYQDTAIYVYDIPSNSNVKFHLYNPTFSAGISTNGPIYAGTADWDPTGQYIIYDEYNHLVSADSADISYWDIGLMQVWNNAQNAWKDSGLVSKLINSLPDGISIGNPVYSKNHRNIVAFDYADTTGAFDAKGADLDNGSVGTILTGNSVPNVPSFSGADDKITFTAQDTAYNMIIGTTPLAADFINGNGGAPTLVSNAEWSVWFRVGLRGGVGINEISTDNVKVYPVPTSDKLVISMSDNSAYTNIQLTDMTGRIVLSQAVTGRTEQLNLSSLQAGVYIIHLRDDSGVNTYTTRIVKN